MTESTAALLILLAATASPAEPRLLESAARLTAVQQLENPNEPQRRRSMVRTWTGIGLAAAGTYLVVDTLFPGKCGATPNEAAKFGVPTCRSARRKFGAGLGGLAVGGLLATYFAYVPVSLQMSPGRVAVGRTIGF